MLITLNFCQACDESTAVVEASSTMSAINVRRVCVCAQSFSCLVSLLFFFDLIVSIELNFCQACDESLSRNSTAVVEASSTMSAINVCRVCVCAVFFVSCHYFFF